MKFVVQLPRIVLGAIFLVFGLNKLLSLFSTPPPAGLAAEFVAGLTAAGYVFPLLAIVEIIAGLLLIIGRFVPLSLLMLAPVTVHILAFHLFLAPAGLPLALLLVALEIGLVVAYRDSFRGVLRMDATPRIGKGKTTTKGHPEGRGQRRHEPLEAS